MTKRDGSVHSDHFHHRLPPTELPLRPLCPTCGAERLTLHARLHVTFEVVATVGYSDELQVLDERLDGCGWEDDDVATCDRCGWNGNVAELHSAAEEAVP